MRLFDLHCDTLYECYRTKQTLWQNECHIDLKRGDTLYRPWVQVFAVWMPDEVRGEAAFAQCCDILCFGREQIAKHAEFVMLITDGKTLEKAVSEEKSGAILAVEGGSALAGRLDTLPRLKELGVKIITLTWNSSNELGHGVGSPDKSGLTAFGKTAVEQMETYGILPDVSHLNEAGFWDVMEYTNGAVLATHSVSASVWAHPRNLTDAQFTALCKRGGLIGLNLSADQLGEQSFDRLEAHLYHYWELGGAAYTALGLDLDGTAVHKKWEGIACASLFYEYLCRKNYEENLLFRLFFGNCYDFFKQL